MDTKRSPRTRGYLVAGLAAIVCWTATTAAQNADALQLAELQSLKKNVAHADTRTRVDATHRVWSIGVASARPDVKQTAISLLLEPLGSSSDHIRMPAIYAVAEIAATTTNVDVKVAAIRALREPLNSEQLAARNAAIDALNGIVRSGRTSDLAASALAMLGPPVRSGNNGVRIPAINAVVRSVLRSQDAGAYATALDLLKAALDSRAMIGGMEVRMMALAAVERIGVDADDVATKAKAMGSAQSYAANAGWEAEARQRARDVSAAIQKTLK